MTIRVVTLTNISKYPSCSAKEEQDLVFLSEIPFWNAHSNLHYKHGKYPFFVLMTGIELRNRLKDVDKHLEKMAKIVDSFKRNHIE